MLNINLKQALKLIYIIVFISLAFFLTNQNYKENRAVSTINLNNYQGDAEYTVDIPANDTVITGDSQDCKLTLNYASTNTADKVIFRDANSNNFGGIKIANTSNPNVNLEFEGTNTFKLLSVAGAVAADEKFIELLYNTKLNLSGPGSLDVYSPYYTPISFCRTQNATNSSITVKNLNLKVTFNLGTSIGMSPYVDYQPGHIEISDSILQINTVYRRDTGTVMGPGIYGVGIGGGVGNRHVSPIFNITNCSINITSNDGFFSGIGAGISSAAIINMYSCSSITVNIYYGTGIGFISTADTIGDLDYFSYINPTKIQILNTTNINVSAYDGSGIGGGYLSSQPNSFVTKSSDCLTIDSISISNSSISASATYHGSGIGGGHTSNQKSKHNDPFMPNIYICNITTVTALSKYGAGIGGGYYAYAYITMNKIESITATSGACGAGIGGGYGSISITNMAISAPNIPTITLEGISEMNLFGGNSGTYSGGAGLGAGGQGHGADIYVENCGIINANGGYNGSGIGGGYSANLYSSIEIKNVLEINALGGLFSSAIGGGAYSYCGFRITLEAIASVNAVNSDSANYVPAVGDGYQTYQSYNEITISSIYVSNVDTFIAENDVQYAPAIGSSYHNSGNAGLNVVFQKCKTVVAISNNGGSGIGASESVSLGSGIPNLNISFKTIDAIYASTDQGAGIGGGTIMQDGVKVNIDNIKLISANSITGAGIGGGTFGEYGGEERYPVKVEISNAAKINSYSSYGSAIGGGYFSNGNVVLVGVKEIISQSDFAPAIGGGLGGIVGGTNRQNSQIVIKEKANNVSFSTNNALNIAIDANTKVTAIGGVNSPGIGINMLNNYVIPTSASLVELVIGGNNTKPLIYAVSGEYVEIPLTSGINNSSCIGAGASISTASSIISLDVSINSGNVYTVDVASAYNNYSSPYSSAINVYQDLSNPSSLNVNGGSIYMYGNASFSDYNGFNNLPSGASLYIGGTPPTVKDASGNAITYPTGFKTRIMNFDSNPLNVEAGAKVVVSPNTGILLASDEGSDLSSRGTGVKFNVPYTYDPKINTAKGGWSYVTLQKYLLKYIATISPMHKVDYGISETDDVNSVSNWVSTPSANTFKLGVLVEDTTYFVFIRIHKNDYFTGHDTNDYEFQRVEIRTINRRTFTVNFFSNGGAGKMASIKVLEDAKLTLPKNTFSKTNDTFLRWNTKSNGKGVNYKDKYTFKEFNIGANLNLYAIWKNTSGSGSGSNTNNILIANAFSNSYKTSYANNVKVIVRIAIVLILLLLSFFKLNMVYTKKKEY